MARIVVFPNGVQINATVKDNLLNALIKAGIQIQSFCGGNGACGKCKIIIINGKNALSTITSSEKRILSPKELKNKYRLACCSIIKKDDDIEIEIPPESLIGYQKLSVTGLEPHVKLNPSIKKKYLKLSKTTLNNISSDFDRIVEAISSSDPSKKFNISYEALRDLPIKLRESDWKLTVSLSNDNMVLNIESGDTTKKNYGVAFDIGTTKIAGYLIDLNKGTLLESASRLNSQRKYGEDIISRISSIIKNERILRKLNKLVINDVNDIIDEFCQKHKIKNDEIYDLTFVGNTAMHHIFLNLMPKYLTLSPYPPVIRESINIRSYKLKIKMNPNCNIHAMPVIAGFVGSDAVADIISTGLYESPKLSMLIDIGTNAEIVLGNNKKIYACSCASGPAFEGAHIKHGMRAQRGAIERIKIEKDLELSYNVIGDVKPKGICGSGVVDAIAEMFKTGMINKNGLLNKENINDRILSINGVNEFIIVPDDKSATGKEITITQSDIREVQLAKAAIYTGCSILMKKYRASPDSIKKLYLAGSFGTYLNPESAKAIGIFPNILDSKITFVGNTAGSGARLALKSRGIRKIAEQVAKKVHYVELGALEEFQREFLNATMIPNMRS